MQTPGYAGSHEDAGATDGVAPAAGVAAGAGPAAVTIASTGASLEGTPSPGHRDLAGDVIAPGRPVRWQPRRRVPVALLHVQPTWSICTSSLVPWPRSKLTDRPE